MDLESILASYPGWSLARSADNADVLRFFGKGAMEGEGLRLRYDRSPDFFEFLSYQSDLAKVFLKRDQSDGMIRGLGTMSVRPGYIGGELTEVGYLGDLRISRDGRERVNWREVYTDVLATCDQNQDLRGCRHFLTAVIDDNRVARKALYESNRSDFVYRPLERYEMVNLLARWPLHRSEPSSFQVEEGSSSSQNELWDFLDSQNRERAFGFAASEWERRLKKWVGLSIKTFLIARSRRGGGIVGCVAPWSPGAAKRIVVDRLPRALDFANLALLPLGARRIREGASLDVGYLTHLEVSGDLGSSEREAIFTDLLRAVRTRQGKDRPHFMSFCDFKSSSLLGGAREYLKQRIPMTLFQVIHRSKCEDPAITRLGRLPPAFEIALV